MYKTSNVPVFVKTQSCVLWQGTMVRLKPRNFQMDFGLLSIDFTVDLYHVYSHMFKIHWQA